MRATRLSRQIRSVRAPPNLARSAFSPNVCTRLSPTPSFSCYEPVRAVHSSSLQTSRFVPPEKRVYSQKKKRGEETANASFGVRQSSGPGEETENALPERKNKRGLGDPRKNVFYLRDITKYFASTDRTLFDDINLNVFYGAKIGILGMNGTGKSTLMKIIAGIEDDFDGEVVVGQGFKVGYLSQEPELDPELNVRENILEGVKDKTAILEEYYELEEALKSDPDDENNKERFSELETIVKKERLFELQSRIERALYALRCPPPESKIDHLSGGEKRRIALARLLISSPDLTSKDEPTNHLDADSVAWLERFLFEYKGTVMAVTHDRYFLDNVAGWILEVDNGSVIPFQGNYSEWLLSKQKRLELEDKKQKSLERHLKEELAWIRTSPRGRQKKNQARVKRYDEMLEERISRTHEPGTIVIPGGPRLGNEVLDVQNLTVSIIGDEPLPTPERPRIESEISPEQNSSRRYLIKDLSFSVPRGAIIGIVGPNGTGKSTLLRALTGRIAPDTGKIKFGATIRWAVVSQDRVELNPYNTVYDEISEGHHELMMGDKPQLMRSYVAGFNFKGDDQKKYISDLSGGERNRVHLAKTLKVNANFLFMDEPTNDIDVEVLRSLEEGLTDFPGCIMVVSHDRWFLDRIATHIIAFRDDQVIFHNGNYSTYIEENPMEKAEGTSTFVNIVKRM